MKKLTILIAMLMATSAWAKDVDLSCESSMALSTKNNKTEVLWETYAERLVIDSKENQVLVASLSRQLTYTEEGDNIRFKDTFEGGYTDFKLNRLTAKLTAMYFILSDPDSGIVGSGSLINYECTVNVPLF